MTAPLYVCIYVPEFPVQALLRLRPGKRKSPVVVVEGNPPFEQVCSANRSAARMGIGPGMTGAELEMFTSLCTLRRSAEEERAARAVLLEAAATFTPRVEVQPVPGPAFVMVLDMTGTSRIFGPAERSVETIGRALKRLRFFVQLAASVNLHTAICIAPAARKCPIIVPAGQEEKHLRSLPLAALHPTPQQAETLSLWGLHTLGDLAALREEDLIVRLGQEGKRLRQLARGEHPHLMVPEESAFTLEEFIAFDAPVEILDSLLFVLGPMLDQLLARAQNRCYALASVRIRLGLDGGGDHERTVKPALPVVQRDILLKLLHLDLQAHPPAAGVINISLHAEPGDRSKVQLGLFAPQHPEPMRLDVTLARIAALVGEDRVGKAVLLDRHRPDSFRMDRFTVTKSAAKDHVAGSAVALRRCRPPVPLTTHLINHRLASFWFENRLYKVHQAYGPWRRSGDWWSSEVWSLEEWDVEASPNSSDTLLCLITHDLLGRRWQLEAFYD